MKSKNLKTSILQITIFFGLSLMVALAIFLFIQTNAQHPQLETMMSDQSTMEAKSFLMAEAAPTLWESLLSNTLVKDIGFGMTLIISLTYLFNHVLKRFAQPLNQLVSAIRNENGKPIELNSDVEELRNLTSSFNAMIAKLNASLEAQRRLNAAMAHELRTPLSIIKTQIDVLKSDPKAELKDYQDTIEVIHQTTRKMNALVNTLLETSQEGSESMNDVLNLEEIVLDVVQDLQVLASDKAIKLSVSTENGPSTLGNQVLLYRALYNLIENAIKYNRSEGRVHVSLEYQKDEYLIKVSDTGLGISTQDLEHIFEPFYRVASTSPKEGLGLGLSLVQSVIHMHSGKIVVTSKLNEGSVFEIKLPLLYSSERKKS